MLLVSIIINLQMKPAKNKKTRLPVLTIWQES
jgi:hypothetical protein